MLSMRDTLNLLNARFVGRAETGYNRYDYTLPTGETLTVKDHYWWYAGVQGEGNEQLWTLAWPKVCAWTEGKKAREDEAAVKAFQSTRAIFERLADHLKAIDWDERIELVEVANEFRKFPVLEIRCGSKSEVYCESSDDGKIRYGSAGGKVFTGSPSMRKALENRYEFSVK